MEKEGEKRGGGGGPEDFLQNFPFCLKCVRGRYFKKVRHPRKITKCITVIFFLSRVMREKSASLLAAPALCRSGAGPGA